MKTVFRTFIPFLFLFISIQICAQNVSLNRVEPPNWWVGMENTELQLLVYGENISQTKPSIHYEGISIKSMSMLENENYLFINLSIAKTTKAGAFDIVFKTKTGKELRYNYELKTKRNRHNPIQTIDGSDVMYLITPDRFANGNPKNDSTEDTLEKVNRSNQDGRHGGDIDGVINHLDYIKELGVTTLWLNPFLENDQPKYSYHGYGISDFYKTDSRFGTNADFINLVDVCHQKEMKVIMDQVFNHCGSGHWWMNDLPSKDWLNQWDTYTRSNFTNIAASDPHASKSDYDLFTKGWFDTNLPDLNLENPFLATYMIQNSIWWIEYAQLDGIRMDTYPYPEKNVMAKWVEEINTEYPNFYIVAETWEAKASSLSYWNNNGVNNDGYKSPVNSVCDYPLYYAMLKAFGNENNIYKIYETLAEDFVYGDAYNNKIFNGNHDVGRLFTLLNDDIDKLKLSMAFTLTSRGIPQLYYGDEILLEGDKPDGQLRKDFPGGWKSDKRNAFTEKGRTPQENGVYNYVSTILNWRKNAIEIHSGKLTHYQPIDNIYVYFRSKNEEKTMVIINNNSKTINKFSLERFKESIQGYSNGTDIITNTYFSSLKSIDLKANSACIIKLSN
ncbi:glycoside hydrolase family 13 protein [Flavivirga spongiicola]|uniref:Glycoside hydrolase family 13 protein n=1 Tax=Flavivirga spongiicola TaxID=421621 RepID=A0ABU7XZI5_9FLAO|nr:glycoside hydrolase family 13 protein [Flavivirga sp. MEBiC05379]MDO5980254.1 glycoside hydrolase family 13 protein [Flavivirga sp. MEBiC05379]